MEPGTSGESRAALRPLRAAAEQIEALRSGVLEGAGLRRAVLEVADAVESSLRRLLRDTERAPLEIRLRALAPDETRPDEVLAELRRSDRISIGLGATVHQLLEAQRRLGAGGAPDAGDAALCLRAVDQLQSEVVAPPAPPPPSDPPADATEVAPDHTLVHSVPPDTGDSRRRWSVVAGALAILLLVVLGIVLLARGGEDSRMAQGIALFRSGSYADAASFFWRYAEDNPDDATPHLYLARIHRRMRRPDLAAEALRRAMDLAPEDAAVHAELGFLLLDTGRAEVAAERFRTAIRYDAESAEAWIGLVRALQAQGQPDAAARALEEAPERVRELLQRQPAPADS